MVMDPEGKAHKSTGEACINYCCVCASFRHLGGTKKTDIRLSPYLILGIYSES